MAGFLENQQDLILQFFREKLANVTYVCIPDPPCYENKGDSAIYMGELALLEKLGIELVPWDDPRVQLVMFTGGGNFGDLWTDVHLARKIFMKILADKPIIVAPQTVFYRNPAALAEDDLWLSNNLKLGFTFCVRDERSFKDSKMFSAARAHLLPDMAFMLDLPKTEIPPIYDVVVLARSDLERTNAGLWESKELLSQKCKEQGITCFITDWRESTTNEPISGHDIFLNPTKTVEQTKRLSKQRLDHAIALLSKGTIVLTDRLHGHILATLLGKKNIVLDNSYGKVSAYINKWTQSCEQVKLVNSIEDSFVEILKEVKRE